MSERPADTTPIANLFPAAGRVLLTGSGKQFVERLGVTAVRDAIYRVMLGENLRNLTEPLSRRRLAQVSGAIVALFTDGLLNDPQFEQSLSSMAAAQLRNARRNDNATIWPAQWLIGLTDKARQNVLRSDAEALNDYLADFEQAINNAAQHCRDQLGDYRLTLAKYVGETGQAVEIGWEGIARLTTAIGAQTLTIRGSDKSMYGKLFEKLILGSFLSLLGFERVDRNRITKDRGVFWLSDSSDIRESDATLLVEPGKLARFDIGFIGRGNSEIAKDKLSRFASEVTTSTGTSTSVTFIIVDRLPETGKTQDAARKIGAEIVQMSMQYWPRGLARLLRQRLGVQSELADMPDGQLHTHLKERLETLPVPDFLSEITVTAAEPQVSTSDQENDTDPAEGS